MTDQAPNYMYGHTVGYDQVQGPFSKEIRSMSM